MLFFSCSFVSDSLRTSGLQHARLLSFTNSGSLHRFVSIESLMPSNHLAFCHSLLLLPSIFPSIRVFANELALCIRWPKYWSSVSASVLPMNIQGWFHLGLTGLISLHSKELSRGFSNTTVQKHRFFGIRLSIHMVQISYPFMTTGNSIALTIQTFVSKVMSLAF